MESSKKNAIKLAYSYDVGSRVRWITNSLKLIRDVHKNEAEHNEIGNNNCESEQVCKVLMYNELKEAYEILQNSKLAGKTSSYLEKIYKYDRYTAIHCIDVGVIAKSIAEEMELSDSEIKECILAGALHDIGKIRIDKEILQKSSSLTAEEREEINRHPLLGYSMVAGMNMPEACKQAVIEHHERINGSGYPLGIDGSELGIVSQIVMVADVFDALTTKRSYKRAYSVEDTLEIMTIDERGKYNNEIIETLKSVYS